MKSIASDTLAVLRNSESEEKIFIFENAIRPVGIASWLKTFEGDDEFEEIEAEVYKIQAFVASRPGTQIVTTLQESRNTSFDEISQVEWQDVDEKAFEVSPHWSSGNPAVDEILNGGLYGVAVIAGEPKVGKSLMSISSAVCAARAGWRVIYCNAELSRAQMACRLQNYMGGIDPTVVENLSIANINPGITIDRLCGELENRIQANDNRLLIVLDSLNRVCEMSQAADSSNGYFSLMREWSAWAMTSRRTTEGRISWILVSELAQHGKTKGQNLEYLADCVVTINATISDDVVDVNVPYSRNTPGGSVGSLMRDFKTGTFERYQ